MLWQLPDFLAVKLKRPRLDSPLQLSLHIDMQVSFHTDPASIPDICTDLERYGVVFVQTTRPNFDRISKLVRGSGKISIPVAVEGPDRDWHSFLVDVDNVDYDGTATNARILQAILAWQNAGSPFPHVEKA